jgi:GT2 family glycosyltransferase
VRRSFPDVTIIEAGRNLGAAGRNVGVEQARTRYVAFADDDSWWAPGALDAAAGVLDAHPRVAVVAARVLVGARGRLDPVCAAMARSPLPPVDGLPGPPVLGFIACGAVVRRDAFLSAGGFHRLFGVGGEEDLLALDLAAAGWSLVYVDRIVAHHHPSPARNTVSRRARQYRNQLWSSWLRLGAGEAVRETFAVVSAARRDAAARRGLWSALVGARTVLAERHVLPETVQRQRRLLDQPAVLLAAKGVALGHEPAR